MSETKKRVVYTAEESRRLFEERRLEREKKYEAEMDEMRVEGIEPDIVRHANQKHVGIPGFSCGFRDAGDGFVDLRVSGIEHGPGGRSVMLVGSPWPRHPFRVKAQDLVEAIIGIWPKLAAPYLTEGAYWPERMTLSLPGTAPVEITCVDGWLELSAGGEALRTRSESVLVIECLRAMVDEITAQGLVSPDLSARWVALSDATDLPRFPLEDFSDADLEATRARHADEERWHAARNGIDIDLWRLSAVDVEARQTLFAAGKGAEPTHEEWMSSWATKASREEVDRMAAEAAAILNVEKDAFVAQAENTRTIYARSTIYRRESERREAFLAAAGDQA